MPEIVPPSQTLLLDLIEQVGEHREQTAKNASKLDLLYNEQQRAADRREKIYDAIGGVRDRVIILEARVQGINRFDERLRLIERQQNVETGRNAIIGTVAGFVGALLLIVAQWLLKSH